MTGADASSGVMNERPDPDVPPPFYLIELLARESIDRRNAGSDAQ
jgi:hypothetical protein